MSQKPQIDIIGAGNLMWSLAPSLENAGFKVHQVYSRTTKNAKLLAKTLYQAKVKKDLDFSGSPASIFILSISDDALAEVVREIILPTDAILVHTSGSMPLSTLGYAPTPNLGVLYPLQTFSKGTITDFREVPILIEADNNFTAQLLIKIAKSISSEVFSIDSTERKKIHLAAVFASNFSNHMISEAKSLLDTAGLSFDLLKPLIVETINKSLSLGPEKAQTGPAIRGDRQILENHMSLLDNQPETKEIYRLISQRILDKYA